MPRESPTLTDNGQQLQMRAVVMAAMDEAGKNESARKPAQGLVDKQVSRRKDVQDVNRLRDGGKCRGKWHEFNGPRSKAPGAHCRSIKFHMFKGVS